MEDSSKNSSDLPRRKAQYATSVMNRHYKIDAWEQRRVYLLPWRTLEEQEDLKIPGHKSCGGDAEHWLLCRGSILKTSSDRQGEILAGEMCTQT